MELEEPYLSNLLPVFGGFVGNVMYEWSQDSDMMLKVIDMLVSCFSC
jgi:hypothetical protein